MLKRSNPLQYADIQFRIGRMMFLFSDGSEQHLTDSTKFFKNALSIDAFANATDESVMQNANLAKAFLTLGEHVAGKSASESAFNPNTTDYDYKDMWNDLKALYEGNRIDSMGLESYGFALYRRIAYFILTDYLNMSKDEVPKAEMEELLNKIEEEINTAEAGLTDIEKSNFGSEIEKARGNIATARQRLSALDGGAA